MDIQYKRRYIVAMAGLMAIAAAPACAQAQRAGLQMDTSPEHAYLGFKSAEDRGQSLDAWFSMGRAGMDAFAGGSGFPYIFPARRAGMSPEANMTGRDGGFAPGPAVAAPWSLAGRYGVGAFSATLGYANYAQMPEPRSGMRADDALTLTGSYRLSHEFSLGMGYGYSSYRNVAYARGGVAGWTLFGDWNVGGVHKLRVGYVKALESGALAQPWSATGARAAPADIWQVLYEYAVSRRTSIDLGYTRVEHGAAGEADTDFFALPMQGFGSGRNSLGVGFRHSF